MTKDTDIVAEKKKSPKNSFKNLLIALLTGAIGGAITSYYAENEETKNQLDYISDEYMEKTLERWKPQIDQLTQDYQDLTFELKKARTRIESLTNDTASLNYEIRIRDDQLEELEDKIEDLENKLKNLKASRYTMSLEFDLITTCIYGDNNYSVYKRTYNQRKKCCIETIQKLQQQYPSIQDFEKIAEQWEPILKCKSDSQNNSFYY